MLMLICINQHQRNIRSSIHVKVKLQIFSMILFYPYKSKTSVVVLFAGKLFWSALMLKFFCYLYSLLPAKSVENVPKHLGKAK